MIDYPNLPVATVTHFDMYQDEATNKFYWVETDTDDIRLATSNCFFSSFMTCWENMEFYARNDEPEYY